MALNMLSLVPFSMFFSNNLDKQNKGTEREDILEKLYVFYINKNIPKKHIELHNVVTCGNQGIDKLVQTLMANVDEQIFEYSRKYNRDEIRRLEEEGYNVIEKEIEIEEPY